MNEFRPQIDSTADITDFVIRTGKKKEVVAPQSRLAAPQRIGDVVSMHAHEADEANPDDPTLLERFLRYPEVQLFAGLIAVSGAAGFLTSDFGREFLQRIQGQ